MYFYVFDALLSTYYRPDTLIVAWDSRKDALVDLLRRWEIDIKYVRNRLIVPEACYRTQQQACNLVCKKDFQQKMLKVE